MLVTQQQEPSESYGDNMQIIMKEQLCNHLGVFNPGSVYEGTEESCKALIAHGYAFEMGKKDPRIEPWNGDEENAEAEPKREIAAKKTVKKSTKRRGRPRKKK